MKPSVCRKAAWIELTVSVTSVDDHSKLNARYFCASNDENRLEEGRFLLAGKRPYYNQFEEHRDSDRSEASGTLSLRVERSVTYCNMR